MVTFNSPYTTKLYEKPHEAELFKPNEVSSNPEARNEVIPAALERFNGVRKALGGVHITEEDKQKFEHAWKHAIKLAGLGKNFMDINPIDRDGYFSETFIEDRRKKVRRGEQYDYINLVYKGTKKPQDLSRLERSGWRKSYQRMRGAAESIGKAAREIHTASLIPGLQPTESQKKLDEAIKKTGEVWAAFDRLEQDRRGHEDIRRQELTGKR